MKPLFQPSRLTLCLAAAFGAVCGSPAFGAAAAPRVPPGFEALLEGQAERVEVMLLGSKLGSFSAEVTLDTLRFDDPKAVALAVEPDESEDSERIRDEIARALAQPLPRNGNLACRGTTAAESGCGYVDTDSAAIIYDDSRGVVDLFLTRDWVAKKTQADRRYQSISSGAQNAFVHRQYANLSAGRDYRNLSVQGAGALGIGRSGHIGTDWSFVRTEATGYSDTRIRFNNLYFRQDLGNQHYAQAGRMDQRNLSGPLGGNFGFSMLPLPRFDGVRLGSTQAYRDTAYSSAEATPVTLLLTRDARVDVFRGNELLGTQYLRAGVQQLDTSSLPTGSYTLSLRIYENGVLNRSENVPFSKTGESFGSTKLQWFAQGGKVVRESNGFAMNEDRANTRAAQAGVRVGLTPNLFLTSGMASVGGTLYNESKVDWQRPLSTGVLTASASYMAGNNGARGNSQQLSFNSGVSWSLYRYQMRGTACDRATPAPQDVGCSDSFSGSVAFPLGSWSMLAGYTYSKARSVPLANQYQFDPYGPIRPFLPQENQRTQQIVSRAIQLGATRTFLWRQSIISARIGVYRNTSDSGSRMTDNGVYAGLTISGASQPPNADGSSSFASAGVDVRTSRNSDAQIGYSANYTRSWDGDGHREIGTSVSGYRDENFTGMLSGRADGRYGNMSATASNSYQRRDGRNYPALTATYASSFALASSGLYWGADSGNTEPSAALAVRVAKNDGDEKEQGHAAEVRGDLGTSVRIGFGDSVLLPMNGYQSSLAEVRDAVDGKSATSINVASGAGTQKYFLPPGKLVVKDVSAEATYTYIGRALNDEGQPKAGAVVLNTLVPNLDEQGSFILDTRQRMSTLYLLHEGELLSCPLVVTGRRDVIQMVGDTHCKSISVSSLPDSIRRLPRISRLLNEAPQTAGTGGGLPSL